MSDRTIATVVLDASIDGEDIVRGLKNNDELILQFVLEMLDAAGSTELEEELVMRVKERLGIVEHVPMPVPTEAA